MSKSCVTWRDEWMVDIFIHVTILILVLSVAFWALVAPVEKKAFDDQIQDQIKQSTSIAFKGMHQDAVKSLSQVDLSVLSKYYDRPDESTSLWNSWLKRSNVLIAVVLVVTLILVWAILSFSCGKCIPLGRLLVENFVLFACIGVVEALFFIKVASKFVPVAPSYMVQQLFSDLKTKLR
tara:strand:- start:687 stop:1223 length:537 start_codon:yes stop_codon:yes gene_type:complete